MPSTAPTTAVGSNLSVSERARRTSVIAKVSGATSYDQARLTLARRLQQRKVIAKVPGSSTYETAKETIARRATTIGRVSGATTYAQARSAIVERQRRQALINKYQAGSYFAALDARKSHLAHTNYVASITQKYGVGNLSEALQSRQANIVARNRLIQNYAPGGTYEQATAKYASIQAKKGIVSPTTQGFFQLLPQLLGLDTAATQGYSGESGGSDFSAGSNQATDTGEAKQPGAISSTVVIAGAVGLLFVVMSLRGKHGRHH